MQSINRFLYGPTPEEKVRAWQGRLRAESRQLDREMRQVSTVDYHIVQVTQYSHYSSTWLRPRRERRLNSLQLKETSSLREYLPGKL